MKPELLWLKLEGLGWQREKGSKRLFGLLNWGRLGDWRLQRFWASQRQPCLPILYGVRGKAGLYVKVLGTAVVMGGCCAAAYLD